MKKEKFDKILSRYFQNNYSRDDYFELNDFIKKKSNKKELEQLMKEQWDTLQIKDNDLTYDETKLLRRINTLLFQKSKVREIIRFYSKIASIIFIPVLLLLGWYILDSKSNESASVISEIYAPMGTRTSFDLPDGSKVYLNSGSSLKFPVDFSKKRHVELNGEAFFKVHSDKKHPFIVSASNFHVVATGTQFNVNNYDRTLNVVLKKGKVDIFNKKNELKQKMNPGFFYSYDARSNKDRYFPVNPIQYTGWSEGRLILENASMNTVIKRLERWYNVRIILKDKELNTLHFKATFIDERFEEVLKLLQHTSTFRYKILPRQYDKDGIPQKETVYLFKN